MSDTFQCGDNTALVSYLYGECEPVERAAIAAHATLCAACAAELAALESARLQLASWTPPEADLGFRVVGARDAGRELQPAPGTGSLSPTPGVSTRPGAWWSQPLPAWAQAAAACLLFAAGLWLGVVRGSAPGASPTVPASGVATSGATLATAVPAAAPAAASRAELAALERRLGAELNELRAAAPQGISEAQMLARVTALLEESEQRQQRELALRTAQVVRDFDSQRQVDLAQIQRNLGQIEGLTGAEVREQREMLNYLMRVSEQP
jgi:hypothetical protein